MGSGKTTSFDIAHKAGVSQATVSRALRDSPLVNPKTRERIKKIARELNYRVDRSAAGLRSQQSHTIALLLYEDPTTDESQINPFFLSMLGHITRTAAKHKYDILISFQQLSDDWLYEYQISNRADGMILLGYGNFAHMAPKLLKLVEEGARFMIFGLSTEELKGHTICGHNLEGGELATRHLVGLGRKRIVFIGDPSDEHPEFKLRYEGYCKALREAGLPVDEQFLVIAKNQETAGYDAMTGLLESGLEFDALFAVTDLIAFGALKCLRKNGVNVPRDISVVGFDDLPAATYFSPSLTTIRQDTRLAAEALVKNLIGLINGEEVQSHQLPLSLIVRGSCGGRKS